jgi:hypothetical protein
LGGGWIGCNRFVECADGVIEAIGGDAGAAEIVLIFGVFGPDGGGLLEEGDGFVGATGLIEKDAEPVHGVGVSGVGIKKGAVGGFGLTDAAAPVVLESDLQQISRHLVLLDT